MNKQIIFSNTGGFPLDEDTLDYLQTSYTGALAAIAKLAGDKVILTGVEVTGATVSAGWISYAGRLIPFAGGSVAAKVYIQNTGSVATFEDGIDKGVFFEETAYCAALGDFNFSDLVRLSTLQNVWMPGDLKQKYVSDAYITANFDVSGYGLNKELGWRILSSAVPAAAGKVLVNRDAADADFNVCGNTGGSKTHTLTEAQMPVHNHSISSLKTAGAGVTGERVTTQSSGTALQVTDNKGGGAAHNNLQPFFVVLTLIKL